MMQRRGTDDPSGLGIYPNWAWSWPANRRVLYNRASCDLDGKPWDPDAQAGLVERDRAEVGGQRRSRLQARLQAGRAHGPVHHESRKAWVASSCRLAPWPTVPSPSTTSRSKARSRIHCIRNQSNNPVVKKFKTPMDKYAKREGRLQHHLHHLSPDRALSLLDQEQSR